MHTLRTIGVVGTAAALLLSASVAFAQGQSGQVAQNAVGGNRATTTTAVTAREAARARAETQRARVAQRLLDIQDKVKQKLAENIAGQFDRLNEKWTDHFTNVLDRYDALLGKIQARADIAAGKGKDVANTTAAIQSAETAITAARAAVTAQAAKTFAFDASTIPATATSTPSGQEKIMQSLRKSFQTLHSSLFKDLFALRDGVMKDARRAVQNALQTLGTIPRVDEDDTTATTTPN